jgi:hypothetical protein
MSFSTGEIVGIALGATAMVLVWVTAIVKLVKIPTDTAKKLEKPLLLLLGPEGIFIHHTPGYERI